MARRALPYAPPHCKCDSTQPTAHLTAASTTQPASTATAKPSEAQVAIFERDSSSAATVGRISSTTSTCWRELGFTGDRRYRQSRFRREYGRDAGARDRSG